MDELRRKFYDEEDSKRQKGNYYNFSSFTGPVKIDLSMDMEEKDSYTECTKYNGEFVDYKDLIPSRDSRLYDFDNWELEGRRGREIFSDVHLRYKYACNEYRLWWCMSNQTQVRRPEPKQEQVKDREYQYFFRSVEKKSLVVVEGAANDVRYVEGRAIRIKFVPDVSGKIVNVSDSVRDLLYEVECEKAKDYLSKCDKTVVTNDWLYSLGMYIRHREDYARLSKEISNHSGVIISYGDRVGQLMVPGRQVKYYDLEPSFFSVNMVKRASATILKKIIKDPENILVLTYVYSQMSDKEKSLVESAQATVIDWSEKGCRIVGKRVTMVSKIVPTEFRKRTVFPYHENFSLLPDKVFLDDGIAMQTWIEARLGPIPVHKKFLPGAIEYKGVALERRKIGERGAYIAHSYEVWDHFKSLRPYLVPVGSVVDRVLCVSKPMCMYRSRVLYAFDKKGNFEPELSHSKWFPLYSAKDSFIGFFFDVSYEKGVTVVEASNSPGTIWVRRELHYYVIETFRDTYFIALISGKEDTFNMYLCLTKAEREKIRTILENEVCYNELLHWFNDAEG